MWVLVKTLPNEIQVVLQNLRDTKFYKIYNMKNQFIGNAKIEDIENNYKKEDGNIWVKELNHI